MKLPDRRSIVAIDPTSRGIAFVFFENGKVLDFGERLRTDRGGDELQLVDELIEGCAADVLVLEDPDAPDCRRRPRLRVVLREIARHARRRKVAVFTIARADVRTAWRRDGVTNKQAVAAEIARRFPELAAVVPPARKRGANEDPRANIFDAASLALHAFGNPSVVP